VYDFHLELAQRCALLSQAAYLDSNHTEFLCNANPEVFGSDDVNTFYSDPDTDTQVLVHLPSKFWNPIVAFRGTSSWKDAHTDLDLTPTPWRGVHVHSGFLKSLTGLSGTVLSDEINKHAKFPSDPEVVFTGHSLGAALAILGAYMCHTTRIFPVHSVHTFGCPRIGLEDFQIDYDMHLRARTHRYVNNNDIVTRVPPRSMSYRHVCVSHYFDEEGHHRPGITDWDKFLDRLKGRWKDLGELGTDGVKDHAMGEYVKCLNHPKVDKVAWSENVSYITEGTRPDYDDGPGG
jgi:triacylglycerol lipase